MRLPKTLDFSPLSSFSRDRCELWLNSPDPDAFFAFLPTSRHYPNEGFEEGILRGLAKRDVAPVEPAKEDSPLMG